MQKKTGRVQEFIGMIKLWFDVMIVRPLQQRDDNVSMFMSIALILMIVSGIIYSVDATILGTSRLDYAQSSPIRTVIFIVFYGSALSIFAMAMFEKYKSNKKK